MRLSILRHCVQYIGPDTGADGVEAALDVEVPLCRLVRILTACSTS